MYPDTDLPPKTVTEERLERLRKALPAPVWTRESAYGGLHVPEDTIRPLAMSRLAGLFERLVKEWKIGPTLAAVALIQFPKRLRKKGLDTASLTEDKLKKIFELYRDGKIPREGIFLAMSGALSVDGLPPVPSEAEVEAEVRRAAGRLAALKIHNPGEKAHILTGLAMAGLRGRAEGAAVAAKARAEIEEKA
jgi:Glu-tRNA(Gln) amidotransferase subunit E-like FAD-binding protein